MSVEGEDYEYGRQGDTHLFAQYRQEIQHDGSRHLPRCGPARRLVQRRIKGEQREQIEDEENRVRPCRRFGGRKRMDWVQQEEQPGNARGHEAGAQS